MNRRVVAWLLVVGSVGFGFVIYAASRQPIALSILDGIGLGFVHESLKGLFGDWVQAMPAWVRFNLPDGLWIFSLVLALRLIWSDQEDKRIGLSLIGFVLALSLFSEWAQAMGWLSGTGDLWDVVVYILGAGLAMLPFRDGFRK